MATVRPGIMKAMGRDPWRIGIVEQVQVDMTEFAEFTRVLECVMDTEKRVDLAAARIVVAGGRPVYAPTGEWPFSGSSLKL